jgi:cytochrome P450
MAETDSEEEVLAALRAGSPISQPRLGVHLVVRHGEASEVLRSRRFGGRAADDGEKADDELALLEMDPPHHSSVRSMLLSTAFARDTLERIEPVVSATCAALVGELAVSGRAELMAELAIPATRAAFADLIGLPAGDRERVYGWIDEMRTDDATSLPEFRGQASRASKQQFHAYVREQADLRRRATQAPDDVFTRLLETTDAQGRGLTDGELLMLMRTLCQAGIGSTTRLIGNLLHELIRVPQLYRTVRADRGLVPAAIEESLRREPPGKLTHRVCREATALAGAAIAPGDCVVVHLGSANRDERLYDDPDEFVLDRANISQHLAFGRGRHKCVGAAAARLIARHVVNALMDQVPEMRLQPGFTYRAIDFTTHGPRRLDVEFDPVGGAA